MFSEHPERFFKTTQVDIVIFPDGREKNPNNFIEISPIKGPVHRMIRETLAYLRTNVILKRIQKPKDNEKSDVVFNYPYQALEEAVVNALYHRDYQEREPVEITVEPDRISILSYAGPDHSISMESIKECKSLRSRRYRNRRLGEFLKELDLTEGRATGIPTIQEELEKNGSPRASIETDADRTYFLLDIPVHPAFNNTPVLNNQESNLTGNLKVFYLAMKENPNITVSELLKIVKGKKKLTNQLIAELKTLGYIKREGRRYGQWVILK